MIDGSYYFNPKSPLVSLFLLFYRTGVFSVKKILNLVEAIMDFSYILVLSLPILRTIYFSFICIETLIVDI